MRKVAPEQRNSTAKTYLISTDLDKRLAAYLETRGISQSVFIRQLIERELERAAA